MSPFFAFFTFLNAWWLMLFIAIPFSTQYAEDAENKKPNDESYIAAPKTIYWKKVFTIATILAALATAVLAVIIKIASGR